MPQADVERGAQRAFLGVLDRHHPEQAAVRLAGRQPVRMRVVPVETRPRAHGEVVRVAARRRDQRHAGAIVGGVDLQPVPMDDRGLGQRVREHDSRALAGFEHEGRIAIVPPAMPCRVGERPRSVGAGAGPGRQAIRAPLLARADPASRRRPERAAARLPPVRTNPRPTPQHAPDIARGAAHANANAPSCVSARRRPKEGISIGIRRKQWTGRDFSGCRRRGRADSESRSRRRTSATASGTARVPRGWRRRCRPGHGSNWRRGSRSSALSH